MNGQIFILLAEESERGGLFDIGATLPLVAIQFLLLMFILNLILYNPLFTLMNQRNEYVLDNLSKASEMLRKATELTTQYEGELAETKKGAAKEISQSQKLQKEGFNTEVELSQKYLDTLGKKRKITRRSLRLKFVKTAFFVFRLFYRFQGCTDNI